MPRLFLLLCFTYTRTTFFSICKFLEFCDEEAVHVVDMRIYSFAQFHSRMKPFLIKFSKPVIPNFQPCFYQFHMSVLQSIFYYCFVFFNADGTGGVNDVASCFRICINTINSRFNQFFLQMTQFSDIIPCFLNFYTCIS